MAGGTFDINTSKTRPGTYINNESKKTQKVSGSLRGTVLIPLISPGWGPNGKTVTITPAAPDGAIAEVGRSIYTVGDTTALVLREALKKASKVIAYFINKGTAATKAVENGPTFTAQYGGTKGNSINISIVANPVGGFDVTIYFDGEKVAAYEGLTTVAELIAASEGNGYVVVSGTGDLAANAGVALTGGTDGTVSNSDVTTFLDFAEGVKFNTAAFPYGADTFETETIAALHAAIKTKVTYLRNSVGNYIQFVVSDFSGDFEGIINVTNSVKLDTGEVLSHSQATAWVAAAEAAASNTTSLTGVRYDGAVEIVDAKTNEEAIAAIKAGEFFFTRQDDEEGNEYIGVEYDINSLTSFTTKKTSDYRKNRVLRVYDTFSELLQRTFPKNKFDNSPDGWDIMDGIGREQCLQSFLDAGAIKNVDKEADFYVDRGRSQGDETYFCVGLEAVDSAEKLYFSIGTR